MDLANIDHASAGALLPFECTNGKTGIHVNGLRGFCRPLPARVRPPLAFPRFLPPPEPSYSFSLPLRTLLRHPPIFSSFSTSTRLSFAFHSPYSPYRSFTACFLLLSGASDPRISVIRAASLEEKLCLLTRVVEWLGWSRFLSPSFRRTLANPLPVEISRAPREFSGHLTTVAR